jgi:lipopolysaccharide export system protein LptA
MKTVVVLLMLTTFAFSADSPSFATTGGSVSSSNASYDGNSLVLKGQVVLDHGLGKMEAEQAILQKQEAGQEFPFSVIELHNQVALSLHTGAKIICDKADLDFNNLTGVLTKIGQGQVVYSDTFKRKKGTEAPWQLTTSSAELQMSKAAVANAKTQYVIETILAKNGVQIDYDSQFQMQADHAVYRKALIDGPKSQFQGSLTAYPKDETSCCQLTHGQDLIDTDSIEIDMIHSQLALHKPRGVLSSAFIPHLEKQQMKFSCDRLLWDQLKNRLLLKGQIQVDEPALGSISADDELQLSQTVDNGKRTLTALCSKGKTIVHYVDPIQQTRHVITSFGSFAFDRAQQHGMAISPVVDGLVPAGQQIHYQEDGMAIFADQASLEYSPTDSGVHPVAISLKGNVHLVSTDPNKPFSCGIADRVSYSPTTRTLILGANPGKRVLFMNEEDSLQVSAQEVHVTQDAANKKQQVKGVGNVKMAFTAEENMMIQKLSKLTAILK